NAGTLQLNNAGALNGGTPNAVAFGAGSTGTLSVNGNNVFVSGLTTNATVGTPVVQNGSTLFAAIEVNNAVANTFNGVIQNGGAGALELVKVGNGTLILGGNNTFTGNILLSA